MKDSYVRLNLEDEEFEILKKNLDLKNLENNEFSNSLMQKIENPIFISRSRKKELSAKNARNTRVLAKKYEIEKAIENLKIKNKTINFSDISRESGVHRMTICKYISKDDLEKINLEIEKRINKWKQKT